ncbi:Helicase, RecD/TraA family [uncultured Desulfatiglans sp.]|nr:Helicase, RecD/TraA family [uncultured Desulfatiglans sp.]
MLGGALQTAARATVQMDAEIGEKSLSGWKAVSKEAGRDGVCCAPAGAVGMGRTGRGARMACELQGRIERVTYSNAESGYSVVQMSVRGERELVTVVGNLMAPTPGEILKMRGAWGNHPRYGRQFKVEYYSTHTPATVYGIERYLGSGLIKGIGPVMAKRIVNVHGEKTLEVIDQDAGRLAAVPGIGPKRIEMIRRAWNDQKEIRQVMIFLQEHGVSSAYATRIWKAYGGRAVQVIEENPYRLATDITGIGFITADRIAEKLGFGRDSTLRAQAGIVYVLQKASEEGHVYYPLGALMDKCREILGVQDEILDRALVGAVGEKQIVIDEDSEEGGWLQKADSKVYPAALHFCETAVSRRILEFTCGERPWRGVDPGKALEWVEAKLAGITLAEKQREAVRAALLNPLLIITGGPGTGKTTIINAIVKIFTRKGARILLAAPTGRAAKRLAEATGMEAKTIHRLLSFAPGKGAFQKNAENPLDCDLLIVDEASMIDLVLMHHLLKAVPPPATLILVGDMFQLPPVGPGYPLQGMIQSGVVKVITLKEIFRQASRSLIVVNAHRIHDGQMPVRNLGRGVPEDFYFIEQDEPEEVLRLIIELVGKRIPERFGLDRREDIQVLTPMHKGVVGASNLNLNLQNALNPRGDTLVWGSRSLRVGDKVMQIRNDYDRDVYNGDLGFIERIDRENQEVWILYDGRKVTYDFRDLEEVVLAYAVSVHKAQGSEYAAVILPVLTQHYMMLQRNLIYTGVTRGRKLAILIGSRRALAMAVRNDRTQRRYSDLVSRLTRKRPGE